MGSQAAPQVFRAQLHPALDLLDRVPVSNAQRVVDLGYGPGDVSRPDAVLFGERAEALSDEQSFYESACGAEGWSLCTKLSGREMND